ncbi:hypothetical protein BX600DRAFT_428978 [Xylariales sp. PMI_506]|nr:hypothetical protein BX600DRAFT_428978 [Xylariales sp. PMI_506]
MFGPSDGSSEARSFGELNTRLGSGGKNSMRIHIDNHHKNKVYTSSSSVSGHVTIEPVKDTDFDKVQILLLGQNKTRLLEGVHSASSSTSHTFLKLEMPIFNTDYPEPRIYEAGCKYNIPFHFVIPNYLTLNACNHSPSGDPVHDQHLCPPPSMGSWDGFEDFSPEMAKVEYSIIVRIFQDLGGKRVKAMETTRLINVLPAFSEQAPLDITSRDKLYKMSKTKSLRKSLLSGKTGTVTVSARQPGAVMLSSDGRSASSTKLQLQLTVERTSTKSQVIPPRITSVSSKISAITYYSAGAMNTLPHMGGSNRHLGAQSRGSYTSTTSLCSTPVQKMKWTHGDCQQFRRNSGSSVSDSECSLYSNDSTGQNRAGGTGAAFFANLEVPIQLPLGKKMFLPTFHSCILSRVYVLSVTVSVSSGGSNTNLTLVLPLQIGVGLTEAMVDHTGLPTFEAAIEEADADAHLRPRTLYVPTMEFERTALPGYADLMSQRVIPAN